MNRSGFLAAGLGVAAVVIFPAACTSSGSGLFPGQIPPVDDSGVSNTGLDGGADGTTNPGSDGGTTNPGSDGGLGSDGGSTHDGGTGPGQDGSTGPTDGAPGDSGSTTSPDGASGGDGASPADGASTADSGGGDSGSTTGPGPVCSQTAKWGTPTLLSASTSMDDTLATITPDELSIAWTVTTDGGIEIEVADRASTANAFDPPQSVSASPFAPGRVALSANGLRLVVVNADTQGFSELSRSARTSASAFGAPVTGSYSNLNGALSGGESYGDPVLSADDNSFYYSVYGNGITSTIHRTARLLPTDAWPEGPAIQASSSLTATGPLRRVPTAISSDEQTLFFWDEVSGTQKAGWINQMTGAFSTFVDLGDRSMANPNAACSSLYYSAQGTGSIDLFVVSDP